MPCNGGAWRSLSFAQLNKTGLFFGSIEVHRPLSVELRQLTETRFMAYVIAEPCINTKDTACVDACPVDCIHPKKDSDKFAAEEMLYIDPVECIDCGACVPVCPVSAIFALDDLPEKWAEYTERNAKYFGR
jgi:NAD-dependent dihydropyrimidine dehydrogenase PreA subunit